MVNPAYAIVAHFDPSGLKSANWRTLLSCLSSVCQKGVIVSTGINDADAQAAIDKGFSVIRRENVGYDFMSYAVGATASKNASPSATRLFCNDSIYVTDPTLFTVSLQTVIDGKPDGQPDGRQSVQFLTRSTEIMAHGQSYCFSIPARIFNRQSFQSFFQNVRPQAKKLDIIHAYEIGLTRLLNTMKEPWSALFKPGSQATAPSRFDNGLNPTHFRADEIMDKHGFVKIERLTKNPENIQNSKAIERHLQEYTSNIQSVPMTIHRDSPKAVVVCHCHAMEDIDELVNALDQLPDGCEIHITSSNPEILTNFKLQWRRRHVPLFLIGIENWGRDVRPFTFAIQNLKLPDDIPVLKIHGKRSLIASDGDSWSNDMLNRLLPSETVINQYIDLFKTRPKLAMLGVAGSYDSNRDDLGFYAGGMYWIRSQCAALALNEVCLDDFEKKESQRDGTLAQALERSIPMTLRTQGWDLMEAGSDQALDPHCVRA